MKKIVKKAKTKVKPKVKAVKRPAKKVAKKATKAKVVEKTSLQFRSLNDLALSNEQPKGLTASEIIQRMCNCAPQMGVNVDCPINKCPREAKYLELRLASAIPMNEVKRRAREFK
jgi:hypothetical protein